jgi:hypothetical protein
VASAALSRPLPPGALFAETGQPVNIMEPLLVMDAKDSSGDQSAKITSTPAGFNLIEKIFYNDNIKQKITIGSIDIAL